MAQTIKLKRSSTQGAEPSTSDLALGEVAINTYDGKMFIKKNDGSDSIVELGTGGNEATYTKTTVTCSANQTTVTGLTYTVGLVDVYLNGAKLLVGQDVTATSGTSIVLAAGAAVNDILQIVAFKAGAAFTPSSPTFTGTLTAPTINATTALKIGGTAITSTPVELNKLDGVTATTAELNLVAGLTPTTAELNYVDGVTSAIQTQINTKVGNIVEDTTPQLGGNLDVQTREITTSTSNGNIKVTPNGSGVFEVKGAGGGDGTLQLNCSANTHGVKIKSPPHSAAASYTLTLPNNDGDADQVLQTNGSGVLTWADSGGGGASVELVATGALPNGNVVQMNTNGTVSVAVLSAVASPSVEDHLQNTAASGHHCCCYDDVNNQIYVFWFESSQWYVAVATPNATNELTFVTTTMSGLTNGYSEWCSALYIPSADKVLFAYHKNNYGLKMHTVKANSSNVASIGAQDTVNLSYSNEFQTIGYDPGTGKAILYYSRYSSGSVSAKLISISGTTIAGGNEVYVSDWNVDYGQAVYDSNHGKHIFVSSRTTNGDVDATVITVSGSSISAGSTVVIITAADKASMVYNPNIERTIIVYGDNGSSKIYGRIISISGTTPSVGSATALGTVTTTHRSIVHYDSLTTKNYVRIDDDMYELSASTSTASLTTGTALYDLGTASDYNHGRMAHNQDIYGGQIGLHFWNYASGRSHSANLTSTTLNADAVIGVVTSAYTNGQTATVSVVSASATISGVAAAKKYYVQRDSTIGTFKDGPYMGVGIGTNTLLVKG